MWKIIWVYLNLNEFNECEYINAICYCKKIHDSFLQNFMNLGKFTIAYVE